MDAMGHVNNTVYFRYMEQARIGWFDTLVPRGEAWKSTGIVIANASCNFKRAINYPGTVDVQVFIGAPGGSSVPTFYELSIDGDLRGREQGIRAPSAGGRARSAAHAAGHARREAARGRRRHSRLLYPHRSGHQARRGQGDQGLRRQGIRA